MTLAPLLALVLGLAPFLAAPVQIPPPAQDAPLVIPTPGDDRPPRRLRQEREAEAEPKTEEQAAAERREALPTLYAELTAAPDEETAAGVAAQIESLWGASGSATADLLSERATAAMQAEDPEMAARHLDDALRFAPDYAEGWVRRAQLYRENDEHSEALAALEKALTADPQHFRALMTLGRTLESMDSPEGAFEAYGEALKVYPFLTDAAEQRARLAPLVEGREL